MNSTKVKALRMLALVMEFLGSQFPAEGGVPSSILSAASCILRKQSVNIRISSIEAELLHTPAARRLILS
jgi:hypothetical protein